VLAVAFGVFVAEVWARDVGFSFPDFDDDLVLGVLGLFELAMSCRRLGWTVSSWSLSRKVNIPFLTELSAKGLRF
jgi:hypothetical protein